MPGDTYLGPLSHNLHFDFSEWLLSNLDRKAVQSQGSRFTEFTFSQHELKEELLVPPHALLHLVEEHSLEINVHKFEELQQDWRDLLSLNGSPS